MVYAADSKSAGGNPVRVRLSPRALQGTTAGLFVPRPPPPGRSRSASPAEPPSRFPGEPYGQCRRRACIGCRESAVSATDGTSQTALDAVHVRVLGALRLLRHPLGPGALHRRAVPRWLGDWAGRRQPDLRLLPRAGVCHGDLRRLHRRQGPRLPALDPGWGGVHGDRPLHDHAAKRPVVQDRAGDDRGGQRPVQAEHLDHGRQALRRQRRASRLRLHDLLHGHQRRRLHRADPHRLAGELGVRHRCDAGLQVRLHRGRRRHAGQPGLVLLRAPAAAGHRPAAGRRAGPQSGGLRGGRGAARDPADLLPAGGRRRRTCSTC